MSNLSELRAIRNRIKKEIYKLEHNKISRLNKDINNLEFILEHFTDENFVFAISIVRAWLPIEQIRQIMSENTVGELVSKAWAVKDMLIEMQNIQSELALEDDTEDMIRGLRIQLRIINEEINRERLK